ncbi:LPS export ABC transporter permease LptG [Acidihalobacter ferrooxydans]|uniref:LPS export ABC transporter permease LptG n=1 Tax=Acidihalobacter ferrooxydans TaxID=1765967 RepID=A0A1P8UHE7_9GAMM|nr:LPS export ABC transporter permease LptG [Acidihalobacter ferrooxydans]APZ43247.1 LPS export ABC transporter permease LptG [Acidihalobacter ferrooxydans]
MKILNRYLVRSVISGALLALFVLSLLDWVFGFLGQLDGSGKGGLSLAQIFLYSLYTEPQRMYELFPSSVLIGSIMSLGAMSANSELIAMRAAGVSIGGVVRAVLRAGIVMVCVAVALGEWLAPAGENKAQALKLAVQAGSTVIASEQDVWARDGSRYIHIGHVLPNHQLRDVSIYEVNGANRLEAVIRAQSAVYVNKGWRLKQVEVSRFSADQVQVKRYAELAQSTLVQPTLFGLLDTRPRDMGAVALARYIGYLKSNGLDAARYELAFWQRFTTPLSALVMLLLAVPFVFGSLRSGGAGQRLFIGVLVGIGFYFVNRLMGQAGLVYGVSPLLSASFPLILFAIAGLLALRRLR